MVEVLKDVSVAWVGVRLVHECGPASLAGHGLQPMAKGSVLDVGGHVQVDLLWHTVHEGFELPGVVLELHLPLLSPTMVDELLGLRCNKIMLQKARQIFATPP